MDASDQYKQAAVNKVPKVFEQMGVTDDTLLGQLKQVSGYIRYASRVYTDYKYPVQLEDLIEQVYQEKIRGVDQLSTVYQETLTALANMQVAGFDGDNFHRMAVERILNNVDKSGLTSNEQEALKSGIKYAIGNVKTPRYDNLKDMPDISQFTEQAMLPGYFAFALRGKNPENLREQQKAYEAIKEVLNKVTQVASEGFKLADFAKKAEDYLARIPVEISEAVKNVLARVAELDGDKLPDEIGGLPQVIGDEVTRKAVKEAREQLNEVERLITNQSQQWGQVREAVQNAVQTISQAYDAAQKAGEDSQNQANYKIKQFVTDLIGTDSKPGGYIKQWIDNSINRDNNLVDVIKSMTVQPADIKTNRDTPHASIYHALGGGSTDFTDVANTRMHMSNIVAAYKNDADSYPYAFIESAEEQKVIAIADVFGGYAVTRAAASAFEFGKNNPASLRPQIILKHLFISYMRSANVFEKASDQVPQFLTDQAQEMDRALSQYLEYGLENITVYNNQDLRSGYSISPGEDLAAQDARKMEGAASDFIRIFHDYTFTSENKWSSYFENKKRSAYMAAYYLRNAQMLMKNNMGKNKLGISSKETSIFSPLQQVKNFAVPANNIYDELQQWLTNILKDVVKTYEDKRPTQEAYNTSTSDAKNELDNAYKLLQEITQAYDITLPTMLHTPEAETEKKEEEKKGDLQAQVQELVDDENYKAAAQKILSGDVAVEQVKNLADNQGKDEAVKVARELKPASINKRRDAAEAKQRAIAYLQQVKNKDLTGTQPRNVETKIENLKK